MSASQKFIARNRAPRVQIEYDVELYGAEKKVQLPFVMGVISDLSGKAEKPAVADRQFLEIDIDNFDDRMNAMAPKAQFSVPNTLTGEGNLSVDLTFTKMSDFSPEAIAEKVEVLKPLLDARRQLSDLTAYMDGKAGAEALLENILAQPELLKAISRDSEATEADTAAALDSLRAAMPADATPKDDSSQTLAALAEQAPQDAAPDTSVGDALATLQPPPEQEDVDQHASALDALRATPTPEAEAEDTTSDVLSGLAAAAVETVVEEDVAANVLDGIVRVEDLPETDDTTDVLKDLADTPVSEDVDTDITADVLSNIDHIETPEEVDTTHDILNEIAAIETKPQPDDGGIDNILADIDTQHPEAVEDTSLDDALGSIDTTALPDGNTDDSTDDILSSVEAVVEEGAEEDVLGEILASIDTTTPEAVIEDTTADILGAIETTDDEAPEEDILGDALASIETIETEEDQGPDIEDVLGTIDTTVPEEEAEDATDDILGAIEPTVDETDQEDALEGALASIEIIDTQEESSDLEDVLGAIDTAVPEAEAVDTAEDILNALEATADDAPEEDILGDALASIEVINAEEEEVSELENVLGAIDTTTPVAETEEITDDILGAIETADDAAPEEDILGDALASIETIETDEDDGSDLDDILGTIDTNAPEGVSEDNSEDILAALDMVVDNETEDVTDDILADLDLTEDAEEASDDLDALLSGIEEPEEDTSDDGDDVLADLSAAAPPTDEDAGDGLDTLLADTSVEENLPPKDDASDDINGLLADLDISGEDTADDDLDSLLADIEEDAPTQAGNEAEGDGDDDLDSLLADLEGNDDIGKEEADAPEDDLDALLSELENDETDGGGDADDLEDLLSDVDNAEASEPAAPSAPPQSPFGLISEPRPDRDGLNRPKFRIALFGDFSGRAARGIIETGDALAARKAIELDVDTVEDVIESFGTTLTLPVGREGGGVEVKLKELDDLHPDELYDNVELFAAISGLRQQLNVGSMADKAVEQLQIWSQTYATPIKLPKRSASTSIPANLKLSDFQALIGDTSGALTQAGPIDNMIAQIVGPHIVKAPDTGTEAMKTSIDEALSSAMRLILHHPDFQAIEAQWRSLDLLARRIETDSKLQIMLYDISAEELAIDLAANEDLSQSGFFKLLTDVLDPEEGTGGFSALCGLYTFEETPPHAELLARIGQVGAHVDAPFFASMSPSYLDTAKEDRHPLVAKAWDTLRDLPEAAYLALASPRFLLRQPYGAKSDSISPFDFEEFTPQEGLKGMLWANPVVLIAILLAGTYKKDGKAMDLGSLMSLGDLPFHYVSDRYGDQVALPCTERNLTSDPTQETLGRGYMPVVWIKGRNEIRLASFRSLGGKIIAGPWETDVPAPRPSPNKPVMDLEMIMPVEGGGGGEDTSVDDLIGDLGEDDDLGLSLDDDTTDLDDLLAGFDDDLSGDNDADDDDEMDPELAALLEGL